MMVVVCVLMCLMCFVDLSSLFVVVMFECVVSRIVFVCVVSMVVFVIGSSGGVLSSMRL